MEGADVFFLPCRRGVLAYSTSHCQCQGRGMADHAVRGTTGGRAALITGNLEKTTADNLQFMPLLRNEINSVGQNIERKNCPNFFRRCTICDSQTLRLSVSLPHSILVAPCLMSPVDLTINYRSYSTTHSSTEYRSSYYISNTFSFDTNYSHMIEVGRS